MLDNARGTAQIYKFQLVVRSMTMQNLTVDQVNQQIDALSELADCLLEKSKLSSETIVVPFVGAGASAIAGIPASGALQQQLYMAFTNKNVNIGRILDEEALFHFPLEAKHGIRKLSLFRFSSIISRFAYGRNIIHDHISSAMRLASHRPLAYELLAHLAKHEFVDHFVVLNYDQLLDEALEDEIGDRLRLITNPDEVPGPKSVHDAKAKYCYLFKPFGSLSTDYYKLKPDDITRYGSESIWRFMLDNIFRPASGDSLPNIIIILIGYAAAEPAFSQLMDELLVDPEREIDIFVIDPRDSLPTSLSNMKKLEKNKISHIRLGADIGMDLLIKLMEIKYLLFNENQVWTPVARHNITSALRYADITFPPTRFKIELILQAIKSRGFFTIEAIAEIERINKFSASAFDVIKKMCDDGILIAYTSSSEEKTAEYGREDYSLVMNNFDLLASKILETRQLPKDAEMDDWIIERHGNSFVANCNKITYREYFKKRFNEIVSAPEVEVSMDAHPSTLWMFKRPLPLTSMSKLTQATSDIFISAFNEAGDGQIKLYAIWTTGEWMFCDEGWAFETIGKTLISRMDNNRLKMMLILSEPPKGKTLRQTRSKKVLDVLNGQLLRGSCKIGRIEWWKQNRVLTILEWKNHGATMRKGIYMRRRLATPLVAPVKVEGEDCRVLLDIFDRYKKKLTINTIDQETLNIEH